MEKVDLGKYFCPNESCRDYGMRGRAILLQVPTMGDIRPLFSGARPVVKGSAPTGQHPFFTCI